MLNQFVSLLEDNTSVEDFVEWGQAVLDSTVKVLLYIYVSTLYTYIVLLYIHTYTYSSVPDKHCRYVARNFGK